MFVLLENFNKVVDIKNNKILLNYFTIINDDFPIRNQDKITLYIWEFETKLIKYFEYSISY